MQPDNGNHVGKRLFGGSFLPDDDHQQLGNKYTIDLHFDGIGAFAPKVAQREVLLDLFEQQLDHPSVFVDGGDLISRQGKIVGHVGIHFTVLCFKQDAPEF